MRQRQPGRGTGEGGTHRREPGCRQHRTGECARHAQSSFSAAEPSWRALGCGPDRILDDCPEASLLQHMDRGCGGSTGRRDLGAQLEGAQFSLDQQGTGALDGLVDQAFGEIAGQSLAHRRLGQRLGEQEGICRARPGDRGHGIQQRLIHHGHLARSP